ncbi:response regulator transcription factor [Campylobacter majalis]|uniref:response regulator transcription factor n=1 Tax=Campylobacter majalis TaxID=2790656 RepID=UPI003D6961EB
MKKILLLSDDFDLQINLNAALYRFNFRVSSMPTAKEFLNEIERLNSYDLYLFEMKAKDLDLKLIKSIRDAQNFTPIMLILDEAIAENFKKIYYAKVDSFIIKPFLMDEILFHIFKLTNVLLGTKFEFKNNILFDKTSLSVKFDNTEISLGKKEGLFLEVLAKNSPHVVTFNEIQHYVYNGENVSQDRIRSILREIRQKVPKLQIKTIRGIGYKIE